MAHEEYRLAAAALALKTFSSPSLSKFAGVNKNTAASWLRRHRNYFEIVEDGLQPATGRGRPEKNWRIRPEAEQVFRAVFQEQYRSLIGGPSTRPFVLEKVERHIGRWQSAARRKAMEEAEAELHLARGLVNMAWKDLAEHFAFTGSLDQSNANAVAELEQVVGLGAFPASDRLKEIAAWMAARMDSFAARGIADQFAGSVLRARAGVR